MRDQVTSRRWWVLVAACAAVVLADLQLANPLTWDEIEFFRATRWVAEGRVPYRDYWEHHAPLQWIVFAPLAKWFGGGAGVGAVLAMRWAQVPFWIAALGLLGSVVRRAGAKAALPLALLLATPSFVRTAVQYRVDTLGSLALVAGLALFAARRWVAFGAMLSLGVLANMRLAPLAVAAALLVSLDRREWLVRLARIAAGVALVAVPFVGLLLAGGVWQEFVGAVLDYNRLSNTLAAPRATNSFLPIVLAPFRNGEVSGIAMWMLAAGGAVAALRRLRERGAGQLVALLWIAAMGAVAMTAVQYDYHMQIVWLLMVPLAATALDRIAVRLPRVSLLAGTVVVVALALNVVRFAGGRPGAELEYQDLVMTEVDRRVPPTGTVWDGTGYALRREPAYRYWFLPAGVRFMAEKRWIERYDIRASPPDAIVHNYRTHNWMIAFPDVGAFATTHYVPLYRNLWIPGFAAAIPAGGVRREWTAVAGGTYDVWSSPLLAKHPWLTRPLRYALIEGPDAPAMAIPLERLPRDAEGRLQWRIDGIPVARGTRTLTLRRGSRLELEAGPGVAAGVLVAPRGVRTLCVAPPERFVF